jgi:hypothetical protein
MLQCRKVTPGILEPGAKANLQVVFNPATNREAPYSVVLPIKITNSTRTRDLTCSGRGYTPKVQFSTRLVSCGPILPAAPGQGPAEGRLELYNPGDRPVEVVCLDLDQQRLLEEQALRAADM